jgi:uncharacterized protein (TIGR03435 family)
VASVKPSTDTAVETTTRVDPGGRIVITAAPLRWLIASAYGDANGGLRPEQVVDFPAGLRSERFDITAQTARVAAETPTHITMKPFMRTLLEERFKLRTHRERRDLPVYALVRSNPNALGPRLSVSAVDCSKDEIRCGFPGGAVGRIKAEALSADLLMQLLASASGRIVVNQTGLKGPFEIDLEYSPDQTADVLVIDSWSGLRRISGGRTGRSAATYIGNDPI